MQFIAASVLFFASFALAAGPLKFDAVAPGAAAVAAVAPPAAVLPTGPYAYLSCTQSQDCVVKTVSMCCGGTQGRCMNNAFPSSAGNCRAGTMGICIANPPAPSSCGCQNGMCIGMM